MNKQRHGGRTRWGCLLSVIGLLLIAGVYYVMHPRSVICEYAPAKDDMAGCSENRVLFHTESGHSLSGWFFFRGENKPLVVCYCGNGSNVASYLPYAKGDPSRSYLMLNYRGYGSSSGKASEETIISDAVEALAHYQAYCKTNIVHLLGFSMGTCVATRVAALQASVARSLTLLCPLDSMYLLAGGEKMGWRNFFVVNHFDVTQDAENVKCPVAAFIADFDGIVPPLRTESLLKHFKVPVERYYRPASHNGIFDCADVPQTIESFWLRTEEIILPQ